MEKTDLFMLEALKASMLNQQINTNSDLIEQEWIELFKKAEAHKIVPLVFQTAYTCLEIPQALVQVLRSRIRQQIMVQVLKTAEFQCIYQHLISAGVRPLVVKGIICRNIYPNPDARLSGDEDILIPWDQFEAAHQAMLDYGMELIEPEQNIYEAYEVSYGKKKSPIRIELHKSLFPPEQEAYSELNRYFETIHAHALPMTIQGTAFWMPEYTDHLFYLICHAFKHFIHSGFGIRQVCDICLFAKTYVDQIDWAAIKANCTEIRADRFTAALFKIGDKYLGISAPDGWPDVDEQALLEDLLSGSVFGAADMSRLHSSTITLNAVAASKQGTKSSVFQSAFPSAAKLKGRYPYLEKYPVLLPMAWADRLVKYRRETKNSASNAPSESIKIGQQRVELLRQYGIIE